MATFEEIRDEAMEFARKNGLDEVEAQKHLRRKLKRAGVPLPANMATEAEFKQQLKETEEFERKRRNERRKKQDKQDKSKMAVGGMANGKKHMYLNKGAFVTDNLPNKGLKMLAKSGAKGRQAVRKMGFDV